MWTQLELFDFDELSRCFWATSLKVLERAKHALRSEDFVQFEYYLNIYSVVVDARRNNLRFLSR